MIKQQTGMKGRDLYAYASPRYRELKRDPEEFRRFLRNNNL